MFRPVRLQGYVRRRTIWILRGDTENFAVLLYILDLCSDNSGFLGYIGREPIVMYTQVCAYVEVMCNEPAKKRCPEPPANGRIRAQKIIY